MKGRYSLFDKFVVIASLLDENSAEKYIEEFKQLKIIRDNFFHGAEAVPLPVGAAQYLLRPDFPSAECS